LEPTGYDQRLPLLPGHNEPHCDVAEQRGDLQRERNPGFEVRKAVGGSANNRPKF